MSGFWTDPQLMGGFDICGDIVRCITELHDGKIVKESPIFDGNNHGFRLRFSQENQVIDLLKSIKTQ